MSAFKKINRQDFYITKYDAKKNWYISTSQFDTYGIQRYGAITSSGIYYINNGDLNNGQYQQLIYHSLEQLYYRSFTSGSWEVSSSYEHYIPSSLTSSYRELTQQALVFSLPREIVGTHIEPGSVRLISDSGEGFYISASYFEGEGTGSFYEVLAYYITTGSIYDNKEGTLKVNTINGSLNVGNVIYSHGLIIITDTGVINYFNSGHNPSIVYKSNQPIYTYNVHCRINEYEFNYSNNPTARTGSSATVRDNLTGSDFSPYVTTIGLYNDSNQLVAVGKMSQPVWKSPDTSMTFLIKISN